MMRTLNTAMLLLALVTAAATAQTHHYWIVLRNKDVSPSLRKNSHSLGITERALKRRAKSLPPDQLIDNLDFPVSESALSQIKQTEVKIRAVSRWLNAVSVEASPQQLQMLHALPSVMRFEPVMKFKRSRPLPSSGQQSPLLKSSGIQGIDYGPSVTQLTNMKVVDLHTIGVNGKGVLIGMLDDGFNNYRSHIALKNINVVADSDFIHNINDVSRQPWESSSQGNHGAGTLSAIGGFDNGQMIGAAYGASFLLAKTEMDSSGNSADFNSEEDTYVAALEWAERLGADITSSSLGYKEFLSPPTYTTADMNGRTTKVARAALIAARKGVLVVTAMGNDGYISGKDNQSQRADTTLISPADADSIISVGATSSDGELAAFSGCGPTSDGRIKPEVVAQGMGVYWADGSTTSGYSVVNGTSCSTPLVAGAAALILSAHPQLTNMQVRDALMRTTIQRKDGTPETAIYPNNYYGCGFVDAYDAAMLSGPVFSNEPHIVKTNNGYLISILLVSKYNLYTDSIFYYYRYDDTSSYSRALLISTSNPNEYSTVVPLSLNDSLPRGYFSAREENPDSIPQHENAPIQYYLFPNYPNPFNGKTILRFDSPNEVEVEVVVFNILGQRVKTIFHGRALHGINIIPYDGTDERGSIIASGVYFARLKTPSSISSIKMLYLK
jgi:serine protease AprX